MTGSVLLDIALIVLLVAYGYSGYRQGLIQSVFSLVGFFAFALLAVWLLPELVSRWDAVAENSRTRVLTLIIGVINNSMGLNNIDANLQLILKGAIILGAVWFQRRKR